MPNCPPLRGITGNRARAEGQNLPGTPGSPVFGGHPTIRAADTVFSLDPDSPVAGPVVLHVVNPRAPATVKGAVLDSLADSVGVVRLVAVAVQDSLRRTVRDLDAKGGFELSLAPGSWRMQAFRDLDRNRLWNPETEPASEVLSLELEPAAQLNDVLLVLRRPRGVP